MKLKRSEEGMMGEENQKVHFLLVCGEMCDQHRSIKSKRNFTVAMMISCVNSCEYKASIIVIITCRFLWLYKDLATLS